MTLLHVITVACFPKFSSAERLIDGFAIDPAVLFFISEAHKGGQLSHMYEN
jgi:hypothetical protein